MGDYYMQIPVKDFYPFVLKYQNHVERIVQKYHYPKEIGDFLTLIVPVMVAKYGLSHEREILSLVESVPIFFSSEENPENPAFFSRRLQLEGGKVVIARSIVLYRYSSVGTLSLLDHLLHEWNHAVNSIRNESYQDEEYFYLRTGLAYFKSRLSNLELVEKKGVLLEEIINTRQTEEMVDYLLSFSKLDIESATLSPLLYALRTATNSQYTSHAYYLQSTVCKTLLHNATFLRTLEQLRFQGEVQDIEDWFDTITGEKNSYQNLLNYLEKSMELEQGLSSTKFFRNRKLNQIRNYIRKMQEIVDLFDRNCNFR